MGNLTNWPFLNEPIYRWFIFVIVMILFLAVWSDVMRIFKSAASVG